MRRLLVLISSVLIVLSLSGCSLDYVEGLDDLPPRAINSEVVASNSELGAKLGDMTATYIKGVLGLLYTESQQNSDMGSENSSIEDTEMTIEDYSYSLPSEAEILNFIDILIATHFPTEQEIIDSVNNFVNTNLPSEQEIQDFIDTLPSEKEIIDTTEIVTDKITSAFNESVSRFEATLNEEDIVGTTYEHILNSLPENLESEKEE